jgi:hypothetical protein
MALNRRKESRGRPPVFLEQPIPIFLRATSIEHQSAPKNKVSLAKLMIKMIVGTEDDEVIMINHKLICTKKKQRSSRAHSSL